MPVLVVHHFKQIGPTFVAGEVNWWSLVIFFILFLSNFSEDIIDEMFGLSFSKFNNESGSYQVIIPNAAHFFLFDQQVWLLF